MSRLKTAVQAHLDATQKPLPAELTQLLAKVDGSLIAEANGKLSLLPQTQMTITDPEDQSAVDVPLPMNLGLLQTVRMLSEADFTELIISSLTGDATVSFQSYLKSNNHYISITSAKSEKTSEDSESTNSASSRRSNRRA